MAQLYINAKQNLYEKDKDFLNPKNEQQDLDDIPWERVLTSDITTAGLRLDKHNAGPGAKDGAYDDIDGMYYYRGEHFHFVDKYKTDSPAGESLLKIIIDGKEYDYDQNLISIPISRGKHTVTVKGRVTEGGKTRDISTTSEMDFTDESNFLGIDLHSYTYPEKRWFAWKDGEAVEYKNRHVARDMHDTWFWQSKRSENWKDTRLTIKKSDIDTFKSYYNKGRLNEKIPLPDSENEAFGITESYKLPYGTDGTLTEIKDLLKVGRMISKAAAAGGVMPCNPDMIDPSEYFPAVKERMKEYLGEGHELLGVIEQINKSFGGKSSYIDFNKCRALSHPEKFLEDKAELDAVKSFGAYLKAKLDELPPEAKRGELADTADSMIKICEGLKPGMHPDDLMALDVTYGGEIHKFESLLISEFNPQTLEESKRKERALNCSYSHAFSREKAMKEIDKSRKKRDKDEEKRSKEEAEQKEKARVAKAQAVKDDYERRRAEFLKNEREKREASSKKSSGKSTNKQQNTVKPKPSLPKIKLPKIELPRLKAPEFNWHMLIMLGAALIAGLYVILESNGIMHTLTFDVNIPYFYRYYGLVALCNWLAATEFVSILTLLLWIFQIVLIVALAILETAIWLTVFVFFLALMILAFVLQLGYLALIPLAAIVFGIILLVRDISEKEISAAGIVISVILLLGALLLSAQYYYLIVSYIISVSH